MKKYLKCIFTLIFLSIFMFSSKSFAESDSSYEYTIEDYYIDMVVNEDNTFDITERITAKFNVPKHGIYRKIPTRNTINRIDGTTSFNIAKITNVSVSDEYSTSISGKYRTLTIGNENKTFTGLKTYIIGYTYNIGNDPLEDADELYYNLIGSEWDTSISDVSFRITMPKEFDKSLLGFSSGNVGSIDSSNVSYSVDGNVIKGSLKNTLSEGQALTVRLTLPDGYFIEQTSYTSLYCTLIIIFCLLCALLAGVLWAKYGRDDNVYETVEFYPPKGYNSAEVAFLYDGEVSTRGMISLLIYLADKGYLKIEETEQQGLFNKAKSFKIIKLKEYDGDNEIEKIFFDGLFSKNRGGAEAYYDMDKAKEIMKEAKSSGDKINFMDAMNMSKVSEGDLLLNAVTASDLYDSFYRVLIRIRKKLASKDNLGKIFESSASAKIKWLYLMVFFIFILITILPILNYGEPEIIFFALLFPGIGFTVLIGSLIGAIKMPKLFGLAWGGMFGGMPWLFMVLPTLLENSMYLTMYIIGLVCIGIILFFSKIMPKRTTMGNEVFEKIRGFKDFLETAEKPELETLVEENPEYFYNILPYTYALGVSNIWMKQFETIALKAPDWYDSTSGFDMHTFGTFMNSTMASASSAMSSSSSSSSGGSGGGSSGGGSGGGGGGSW